MTPTSDTNQRPGSGEAGLWICAMCPTVKSSSAGNCPECGMKLTSRPTVLVFKCLKHPIRQEVEGTCPICAGPLAQVTMGVVWTCDEHPETEAHRPGLCARCSKDLVEDLVELPHGDHNPRHGGQFFMAPDNWHHLEGALPRSHEFRMYLYDNFTRPLDASKASGTIAVVLPDQNLEKEPRETLTLPLRPSDDGHYLTGRLPRKLARLPVELTALIKFSTQKPGEIPHRFDFLFESLSEISETSADQLAERELDPDLRKNVTVDPSQLSPTELMIRVLGLDLELRSVIHAKRWKSLYEPALAAKDIALAIGARKDYAMKLSAEKAADLERALRDVVRAAWLLDASGDRGDGKKVLDAYAIFASGRRRLRSLFPELDEPEPIR